MKQKPWISILILIGYCIPFSFLGMYGDVMHGTMHLYIGMILGFALLCWACIKTHTVSVLLIGNVLSWGSSTLCLHLLQTLEWKRYFKPYTTSHLLILISAIAFILQIIVWILIKSE